MDFVAEAAAEQLAALLLTLQFPAADSASALPLLRDCVNLLPTLTYARDIAALTRMILLSPAIWPEYYDSYDLGSAHPVGLHVSEAFRSAARARVNRQASYGQSTDEDLSLFVIAAVAGLNTCSNAPLRAICALSGLMSALPIAAAMPEPQIAFINLLNIISRDTAKVDDPVSFSICGTIAYSSTEQNFRSRIVVSPGLVSILSKVLLAPEMHPDVRSYAGPIAQFISHLYRFMSTSSNIRLSLQPLAVLFDDSVRLRHTEVSKETTFGLIAILTGLVDGIQSRGSRKWYLFANQDPSEIRISKQIILILRNLSTTIYGIAVGGFAAESYLHSAAVGILLSNCGPPIDDLLDDLQNTKSEPEILFELNTAEKMLLSSPASTPLPSPVLSKIVRPAQKIIASVGSSRDNISRAIHEAAHAVFLASLIIPALADENVRYIHSTYLSSVIGLYESQIISNKQLKAAVNSLSGAFTPGSGVLSSAAPSFGEDHIVPAVRGLITGGPNAALLTEIFVDAVLACAPVERIEFWLDSVEGTRSVVAERIKLGEIPSVCTEGVVRWWYSGSDSADIVSSRL
ncbi:uncharacterized protein V2V93DRAFT_370560 [Kockiozyma suomiensis]|uniref:uncharacterized protein n=1 Tax=Kockiozyma suomiensis TaxID=1337062 RepID=UPI003342FA80